MTHQSQGLVDEIDTYLKRLFPICRSITGEGNRETLRILQEIVPLTIKEYPTGQKVYDWVIPKEWNIRDAWIKNSAGEKIVDFKDSNLHVVSYSIPVHKQMKLAELKGFLHFREDLPEAIPYRTTYYQENWGFCLSHDDYKKHFNDQESYEVFIDSELKDGSLTIGELLIKGKNDKEYLISTYICHPSLANDNLSGPLLTAFLAKELLKRDLNFSYRIIFVPETIGAIAYCANNEKNMQKIDCGLLITTVGGPGNFGYKQSWQRDHFINGSIKQTFAENNIKNPEVYPFDIHGSDERQYSSQGFRINIACITKDKYYEYDEYHTSLDNLSFVKAENINQSLILYRKLIDKIDANIFLLKTTGNCEPMLSKYGLYPQLGGQFNQKLNPDIDLDSVLWLLFYADGKEPIESISLKTGIETNDLTKTALILEKKKLLKLIR